MTIPWLKILKFGLPVLLVLGIGWWVYSLGSAAGQASVQAKWDHQKQVDADAVKAEKDRIAKDETAHRAEDRKISDELVTAKETAAAAIADARTATGKLREDSSRRESVYRAQAEAGAVERANLASHAAQLDRALTEGVGLVQELNATLELRDGQIRGLAAQIRNDRQLIEGSTTDGK